MTKAADDTSLDEDKKVLQLRDKWYEEAHDKSMSFDKRWPWQKSPFEKFVAKLSKHNHCYSSICYAVTAVGLAAMWAMNRTPQGGITGFQAGGVMWEFIQQWGFDYKDKPLRMMNFGDMLYPQNSDKFEQKISASTWEWLQQHAAKNLQSNPSAHPNVLKHWQNIVDGIPPFGWLPEKENV